MPSPFGHTNMILDRRYFFGRTKQLDAIFDRLNGIQAGSVNLVGDRRIGRSSLLWHVKIIASERLVNPNAFCFLYLDLQDEAMRSPADFRRAVLKGLGRPCAQREVSPSVFDDELASLRANGVRPVLLLDEFESLCETGNSFGEDFFDGARKRANAGEITFVIATQRPLHELELTTPKLSNLHGICNMVPLGNLTDSEANSLLTQPTEYPFTKVQVELARSMAGTHPLRLNLAADAIYDQLEVGKGGWGKSAARVARVEYRKKEQYIFVTGGSITSARHGISRALRWCLNWMDDRELRRVVAGIVIAGGVSICLFATLLVLGWVSLEQVRDSVVQRTIGTYTPAPARTASPGPNLPASLTPTP